MRSDVNWLLASPRPSQERHHPGGMMALVDPYIANPQRLRTGVVEFHSFDPDRLDGLPGPAIRLLRRAQAEGESFRHPITATRFPTGQ